MLFHGVQAFCDLLDSRKEPFGFPIDPFSSALSLRGLFVYPRPEFGYLGGDLFERIAQRGQRLEQVVPVKAPEVGGAGVPAILKEGQPCPHPGTPLYPAGNVAGSVLNIPDVPGKIWNRASRSRFAPAESLRFCGSSAHRSIQRVTFSTCFPRSPSCASVSGFKKEIATVIMDKARTQRVCWMASCGYGITGLMGLRMSFLQKKGKPRSGAKALFLWFC